ncbi:hypothetical protein E2C01_099527 [Portunus trituberculatus]|uniref:Uncharacterized protein n=1 Tax=Portunus trituberculatus TaxID=210409 RepID=A0A5B7K428_PORTR|nr:hypothetical protein [Portunus trituberculatus]
MDNQVNEGRENTCRYVHVMSRHYAKGQQVKAPVGSIVTVAGKLCSPSCVTATPPRDLPLVNTE